ncbi:MAG: ParA family protein [Clostridiales bacterium]|nr:ParA family protein [Clostridiales bacterium]
MTKIISVMTQKGGVGKTTVVGSLAAVMHKQGSKVLVIDMDPQGNLSFSMGADTEHSATIYEALKGEVKASFAIQHCSMADIIPANILLSGIELEFTGHEREFILKRVLDSFKGMYDYILIDSPPGLGILTVNSLTVADYVIIPMLPDIFSLQGVALVYETIEHVKNACNPNLKIAGILLNRFNPRFILSKEVYGTAELISKNLGIPLFKTYIRNCLALSEAQSLQLDVTSYARYSTGVKDFFSLASELSQKGI